MADTVFPLCRAFRIDASQVHLSFQSHRGNAAGGTALRRFNGALVAGTGITIHVDDLGDDLAPFFHEHAVSDHQSQPLDLIVIVQRRAGYRGAAQFHRLQNSHRRQDARTAHPRFHVQQAAGHALGGEFEGDGPARRFGRRAHALLEFQIIHLHDDPVDLERQGLPPTLPSGLEPLHFSQRFEPLRVFAYREVQGAEPCQGLPMGRFGRPRSHRVNDHAQSAGADNAGIHHAQGSRGGVAGRLEWRFAHALPRSVEAAEGFQAVVNFAPHLQIDGLRQDVGQAANGLGVGCHHFAGRTVPPGHGRGQHAALVVDGDGQSIDLELRDVRQVFAGNEPQESSLPLAQLIQRVSVGQAEHGALVAAGGGGLHRRGHDPGRRRFPSAPFRPAGLQTREFGDQRVIGLIAANLLIAVEIFQQTALVFQAYGVQGFAVF